MARDQPAQIRNHPGEARAGERREPRLTSSRPNSIESETKPKQARSNSEALQKDLSHYQDTVKMKDEHISFLEATVHQALEKLPKSLPPSQEEAKAKALVAVLETMMVGGSPMIWSNIRTLNLLGLGLNMIGTGLIIIGSSDSINPPFVNRDGQVDEVFLPSINKWSALRLKIYIDP